VQGSRRQADHPTRHEAHVRNTPASGRVQPYVVQRRLAHASVEMTLNIYSHVPPSIGE
jgi:integrase